MPTVERFRAHPTALGHVRPFVRERAVASGLGRGAIDDLVQAVSEACANAIQYGHGGQVRVRWEAVPGQVAVEVHDDGVFQPSARPRTIRARPPRTLLAERGRGIPLMAALTDELSIRRPTGRVRWCGWSSRAGRRERPSPPAVKVPGGRSPNRPLLESPSRVVAVAQLG